MSRLRACLSALLLVVCTACTAIDRLVILHLNDFHGQIQPLEVVTRPGVTQLRGGFVELTDYIAGERRNRPPGTAIWLTDAGDWFQGTPEGNEDRGWSVMACRNRLGFTVAGVGNHEYDFGEQNLIRLIGRARYPILGANIVGKDGRNLPYVEPYRILEVGGLSVAVIGLIAGDTKNFSTGPFGNAEFKDEFATLRELLPRLRGKVDARILITHCGIQKDLEIAKAFPEIALILGGHSHTALPLGRKVGDTWIAQSRGRGTAVSRIEIRIDHAARKLRVEKVRLVDMRTKVHSMAGQSIARPTERFLAKTFAHIGPKWDQPLGQVTGAKDKIARSAPTSSPGGNFVADLIRRVAGTQVGLMNKGGIRAVLHPGPITRRQVFQLLPFDNAVVKMQVTGEQLRTLLAQGLRRGRSPLEISGGRYAYRVTKGGARELVWVEVGGQKVDVATRYDIATNSFLAAGGDGFSAFTKAKQERVSPLWMRDFLVRELTQGAGVIALSDDSRIVVVE